MMLEPSTPRGREVKERIVAVAAALMYKRGINAVSIEDIVTASGTGKGQFYHYFSSKEELTSEVLRHQLDQVLDEQSLFQLHTWQGIHSWFDALVEMQEIRRDFRGCPLGSIASEVLDHGEHLRSRAADAFSRWESVLAAGLRGMLARGALRPDADPDALAEATIAILQGGYLLTSIKRNVRPMRSAVAAASSHLHSSASP